jgi:hypothetical protein
MDIAFTHQAMSMISPIGKPQIPEFLRVGKMGSSIMEDLKKYMNLAFMVASLLILSYSNAIGLILLLRDGLGLCYEIRQDSILPRDDVYVVAQQVTQVYYLPYVCHDKENIKGWDIVHKVSPHGKLPLPNDEDYNFNPNTYDREFFQEEGLEGRFEIDLTEAIGMEVDNEWVDDENARDEVVNEKDLQMLDRL